MSSSPAAAVDVAGVAAPPVQRAGLNWKIFTTLMVLSLVGSLVAIPYVLSVVKQMDVKLPPGVDPSVIWAVAMAVQTVVELVMSAVAALLGLWLGRRVGLGAPVLEAWMSRRPDPIARPRRWVPVSLLVGAVAGLAVIGLAFALRPLMPPVPRPFVSPPPWQGFLVSIGAGIREEIWCRLGLMTVLVWAGSRLARAANGTAPTGIVWTANVLAALMFGALHLPQASGIYGGLTMPLVTAVLLLNGVAGLAFGWLYWRRGLLAAMLAHFTADVVLKSILPVVQGALGG